MKILYIGPKVLKVMTGGDSVNKRNEDILKNILQDDFLTFYIDKPENSIFQKLKGYLGGINESNIAEIINVILKNNISCVFLSQSFYGKLCQKLKAYFPNLKIITFYHNIEKHYAREYLRVAGLNHYPFYLLATYNERLTMKYSTYNFVLNQRDSLLMHDIYKKTSDFTLPVSYKDVLDESKIIRESNSQLKILFVGTAFFGNLPGIEFFVKKVMPYVNAELIIVGKGMDNYKTKFETSKNIKVLGFVEDLSLYYYCASIVVAPIFSGGGMKTKIAEALMYGKTILGTKEAFEGYEKNNLVTIECNTADEFISTINQLDSNISPFNEIARELYKKHYDDAILQSDLKQYLSDLM